MMTLQIVVLVLMALGAALGIPVSDIVEGATGQYSLPQFDTNATRAAAIVVKRQGFLYGTAPLTPTVFPNGTLGIARIQQDLAIFQVDAGYVTSALAVDTPLAAQALTANGGFKSLDDYSHLLYVNQWKNSIPAGEDSGVLTNYTQDLQFSMERLSLNPFPLHRFKPSDNLPFTIDPTLAISITGSTLQALQALGRLFVVDHSYQAKYPKTSRFGGACTAYFYIANDGTFLPLAIKTNTGSNLTYTPKDTPNDWLLAKIMFNVNDVFHADTFHLSFTHATAESTHEAAIRTLSDNHPVMALLDRLMVGAYAVQVVGSQLLFNPGGSFDKDFYTNSTGALQSQKDFYPTIGNFVNGYLANYFKQLIGPKTPVGSALKSFPFYEDASTLRGIIQEFMYTFVYTYYASDKVVIHDTELQAWFVEVNKGAMVINFPCTGTGYNACGRDDLVDVLTHFAYLTGIAHHALNTGDLASSAGTLPFHPASLYAPLPTQKGVTSLLPFLPSVPEALFHVNLITAFNRPQFEAQNRTLAYAYSDPTFLSRFPAKIGVAANKYNANMLAFSKQIRARTFDENGLSQGMPFLYKNLDPGTIPWSLTV